MRVELRGKLSIPGTPPISQDEASKVVRDYLSANTLQGARLQSVQLLGVQAVSDDIDAGHFGQPINELTRIQSWATNIDFLALFWIEEKG